MGKEIIIQVDPHETRVGILEDKKLVELYVEREERIVGSIYKGRVVDIADSMEAAFVDIGLERNAFLPFTNIWLDRDKREKVKGIRSLLKEGQEVLVQVSRAPIGDKGAKVNTRIAIPGRYLVLLAPKSERVGVSMKIEDPGERIRLKELAYSIKPRDGGLIVRTEAEGKGKEELVRDLRFLVDLWKKIVGTAKKSVAPSVIFRDLRLIYRAVRDFFNEEVERLVIDSEGDYKKILELLDFLGPELKGRVFYYTDGVPLFEYYGIEDEIAKLFRRRIWLKSGGFITIDETEAMTCIDVNTGKFTGGDRLVDTIFRTNLEACREIARQIVLRGIGGMIIVDFIDMEDAAKSVMLLAELEAALKKDRARPRVIGLGSHELVSIVRKRVGKSLSELTYDVCSCCRGRGKVWSAKTVGIKVARKLKEVCKGGVGKAVLISVHPEVANFLIGWDEQDWVRLEGETGRLIYLRCNDNLDEFEIKPLNEMEEAEVMAMAPELAQMFELEVKECKLLELPKFYGVVDGFLVIVEGGEQFVGQRVGVELVEVNRAFGRGRVVR